MGILNISLPNELETFVDEQVERRGYSSNSEYICELVYKEQERIMLRELLLAGPASTMTTPVDETYFETLRQQVRAAILSNRGK